MLISEFILAYYLGIMVSMGNFLIMWRMVRTHGENKLIEKRIVNILRNRKRRA